MIEKETKRKPIFQLFKKREDGQSMVEFALILPLLLVLVLGVIQFGIIFNGYIAITSAAREAVRAGAVGATVSEMNTIIDNSLAGAFSVTLGDVDYYVNNDDTNVDGDRDRPSDYPDELGVLGEELRVEINGEVNIIIPFIGGDGNTGFPLFSKASMRIEQYVD